LISAIYVLAEFPSEGKGGYCRKIIQPVLMKFDNYITARKNKNCILQCDFRKNHLLTHLAFLAFDNLAQTRSVKLTIESFIKEAQAINNVSIYASNTWKHNVQKL